MPDINNKNIKSSSFYRVIAATLTMGGVSLLTPMIASAQTTTTAAGTTIRNTATGTYVDPNNPANILNTTSNTVTVTVAEVAGITVVGSGVTDTTPLTPILPGDSLIYLFTVTNVGNEVTQFQIPNLATTTGAATVSGTLPGGTPNSLQYSVDGGTTWINIGPGGATTASIPVNGSVLVRVPVTVQVGGTGNITVRLGQTPGDAQNQLRNADGGDVYTVDANPATVSINGVREASATQTSVIGTTPATRALATILKTRTAYDPVSTAALNDDLITYGLSLRVENNDVTNSGVTTAALTGTPITVNTTPNQSRILISDAIPANTVLNVAPTPPAGWLVVYSTAAIGTTTAEAVTDWTTTAPTALGTVTRVGFINDPAVVASVAPGTTVTGFNIQVRTTITNTTATPIYNIAQVVGTTVGGGPKVYDNSGDQNPSNFNSGGNTFPTTTDPGIAVGTPTNLDPANNNTRPNSDIGGFNPFTVSVPAANSLLNGPDQQPAALGPTDNNDDFTNKSALIPPNTPPGTTTLNPAPVSFTNTVRNTGTNPANISLLPTPPATLTDLPIGTSVTVSYLALSATYTYNGTAFTFVSGVGLVGGNAISATNPIRIDGVAANGGEATYGVSVDLPVGTPLSTDTAAQGVTPTNNPITTIERGFPVPVTAFVDTITTTGTLGVGLGFPDTAETRNISIDRVYTGFLQLLKESRILQGTGPAVIGAQGTYSILPKTPAAGNIIQYRITYRNISSGGGSNSTILNAGNIVITEDGIIAGGNNWAADIDANGQIDTSNVIGQAIDSGTSTITFFSGNPSTTPLASEQSGLTAATDVTKYINTVTGTVIPGASRTFSFQRRVN